MNQETRSMLARPRPVFEVLSDSLRERICAHEFMPGEALDEHRIAASYGVGRSVVRDALCVLDRSRLVRFESEGRFHVACPSSQDVAQLFDILEQLERLTVHQAANARSLPDEGCPFWPALCQASGNGYLAAQIDSVHTHLKLALGAVFESPAMQPPEALQERLRQSILSGNVDHAEQGLLGYWQCRRETATNLPPFRHALPHASCGNCVPDPVQGGCTAGAVKEDMADDEVFPVFAV